MRTTTIAQVVSLGLAALFTVGAQAATYSASPAAGVPDNSNLDSTITVTDSGTVTDLSVTVSVDNTWLGDLIYTLTHNGNSVSLMDRPGRAPGATSGVGDSSNLSGDAPLTFSMSALTAAESIGFGCATAAIVGLSAGCTETEYLSDQSLAVFFGGPLAGDWTLNVSDNASGDATTFNAWSMTVTTSNAVPEPGSLALAGLALAGLLTSRRRSA